MFDSAPPQDQPETEAFDTDMDSDAFVPETPNKANDSTMENIDQQEVTVAFFPPLFEQRRAWILDVLRNERVTSVCITIQVLIFFQTVY